MFNQMGLIDAWGTGVKRIRDAAAEYGLPEPEFLEMDDIRNQFLHLILYPTTDRTFLLER